MSTLIINNGNIPLNTFQVGFYDTLSKACGAVSANGLQGFTTLTPSTGDIVYNYDATPHTGNFSYIKIFNYNNITNNNKLFMVNGGTGILGIEQTCNT